MERDKTNPEDDAFNVAFLDTKNQQNRKDARVEKSPLFFSKRLLISILLFLWNTVIWVIRNNINVAVVEMTSNKTVLQGNLTTASLPEFQWDSKTISLVLGLIHCGGLLSFTSGFVISKLGGSMSCTLSMIICGITTFLYPICLRYNFHLFLVFRLVTGVFFSLYISCFSEIFARWIPKSERSMLMTFCYGGFYIGAIIVYPICGSIATEWGWPMVFYSTGSICTIMAILCPTILKSDPSQDRSISKKELLYIIDGIETSSSKKQVAFPYKSILTSAPIGALCMANIATFCGLTFLLDCLPLYIKTITGNNTANVGMISSIPSIVTTFMYSFSGVLIVYWKNKTNISSTLMYKILMGVALITQTALFLALTLVSNFTIIMLIIVAIRLFTPFNILIVQLIIVDIAPGYTGMISGIVAFCGSFITISTQMTIGHMTPNHSLEEWNRCFVLIACLLAICSAIFTLFGSSDPQPWSLSTTFNEEKGKSLHTSVKLIKK
ncbi:vesicular glutamate transporter 2-like isoform X2 [Planococcus citri]|uniref:vesicular glutamate transporter 2-like isoform X2 n=1 Tax=Planococcus citri TaxID=170843 RepID=UPI0031F838DB